MFESALFGALDTSSKQLARITFSGKPPNGKGASHLAVNTNPEAPNSAEFRRFVTAP
jgi:hypothetical protein